MSDVVIPMPGPAEIATAVISDLNGPVSGAVFDGQSNWAIDNPAVATISPVDLMNELVTPVSAGVANLSVTGVYQGFTLTAQASVTVTLVNGGFSLDIEWAPATPPAAPK